MSNWTDIKFTIRAIGDRQLLTRFREFMAAQPFEVTSAVAFYVGGGGPLTLHPEREAQAVERLDEEAGHWMIERVAPRKN